MTDELDPVRALLPGYRLQLVERLDSGARSSVLRVRATAPDGTGHAFVVKQYRTAGEGWVRETAALSVVRGAARVPRVVAVGEAPPLLVTEDLGTGGSVADALLGPDPTRAADAVVAWAEAVAQLHAATRDCEGDLRAATEERQGDLPLDRSPIATGIDDAVRVLDRECAALGAAVPAGALEQFRGLTSRLGTAHTAALTPADTCPDNNVRTDGGLVLIDFEGAEWRHLAWDVAYLTVPWPTCWCSWQLPAEVSRRAVAAYRAAAAAAFPEVADEQFARDVEAAAVGWALLSTTLFLDNALGSDPALNPRRPTPSRRAMIQHRLAGAAASTELPAVAELAANLRAALHERWGDVPLALAPAFRAAQ